MNFEKQLNSQLKKDSDSIKVPDYLKHHIRKKVEQEASINGKLGLKKRKPIYLTTAVAAAFLIIGGSGYTSSTMADVLSNVPMVGIIYENVSADYGLKEAREKGLTQGFNQTVTDENISMTITDVYYDGQSFSIGYQLVHQGKEEWGPEVKGLKLDYKAKGAKLGQSSASSMMEEVKGNQITGLILIDADHFDKEFVLKLDVNEIDRVKGKWSFNIPVTSEFLEGGSIHSVAPNFKTKALGADILIKELTFTPSGIRLIAETISEKGTGNNFGFNIKGVGISSSGGGSGDYGSQHHKDDKDHIIHRLSLNPVTEVPNEVTIVVYDLNNEINGTNYEYEFVVPVK